MFMENPHDLPTSSGQSGAEMQREDVKAAVSRAANDAKVKIVWLDETQLRFRVSFHGDRTAYKRLLGRLTDLKLGATTQISVGVVGSVPSYCDCVVDVPDNWQLPG
jgi:hypothetical protein